MASSEEFQSVLDSISDDQTVPKVYANDFLAGLGLMDITLLLFHNEKVTSSVTLPFGLAKQLKNLLDKMLQDYERMSGTEIKLPSEIALNYAADDDEEKQPESDTAQ